MSKIWATFVIKYVAKTFLKHPNLVTLLSGNTFLSGVDVELKGAELLTTHDQFFFFFLA